MPQEEFFNDVYKIIGRITYDLISLMQYVLLRNYHFTMTSIATFANDLFKSLYFGKSSTGYPSISKCTRRIPDDLGASTPGLA